MFTLVCALFMRATKNAIDESEDENELAATDAVSTLEDQANNEEELLEQTDDTSHGTWNDGQTYKTNDLPVDENANENGEEEASNDVHGPFENDQFKNEASTAKKLLFVFESWNETAAGMIKYFCAKSEICSNCECYSTTLDPELGENIKENAKAAGVTLIYPQRINISKQDSTHLNLLPYLILYYKHHNPHLNEVTYVIGCRQTTERVAREIKQSIFPKAELRYVDASCIPPPPAALFLYIEWNKNHLGLSQCHRTLLQDFCARKTKTGEILKVFATVNDLEIKEEQRKDAELCGVNLIPRQRKNDNTKYSIDMDFLLHHETFFPCLRDLKNIQYIIGYAPKTAEAAIDIKKKFFPRSKLYLINHENPDNEYQSSRNSQQNLNKQMLDMAAEADVLISVGPSMYGHYKNEYRALPKKPHKELVPKPRALFFIENVERPEKTVDKHVILSYGKVNRDNVNRYKKLVEEISKCGKAQALLRIKPPQWRICCLSSEEDEEWVKREITGEIECADMQLQLYTYCSAEQLVVYLKQAHLYVTTPFSEDFPNLEALAIGLPLLTHGNSELSTILEHYFDEEGNPCIMSSNKEWSDELRKGLYKLDEAFERAALLKSMYKDSIFVTKSYARFAALFFPKTDLKSLEVVLSMENFGPEHVNFEQQCQEVLNKQAAKCPLKTAQKAVREELGEVPVLELKSGSLSISIGFPNLLKLYRFEAGCKSGSFAKAFDPVLLTDEMRNEADKLGIKLKLKATYDQERFEEVELFFLNRDGGGVEPTVISEESEDLVLTEAQQRLLAQLQAEDEGRDQSENMATRSSAQSIESMVNLQDKSFLLSKEDDTRVLKSPSLCAATDETIKTGKEDRDTRGVTIALPKKTEMTTDEDEEVVLYSQQARLDQFDHDTKEWKEHHEGELKFVMEKVTGQIRMSIGEDQSSADFAELYLDTEMELRPKSASDSSWRLNVKDFTAEGPNTERQIALIFKTSEEAKEFKQNFEQCLEMLAGINKKAERLQLTRIEDTLEAIGALLKDRSRRSAQMWRCDSCLVSNSYLTIKCGGCDAWQPELLQLDKGL